MLTTGRSLLELALHDQENERSVVATADKQLRPIALGTARMASRHVIDLAL